MTEKNPDRYKDMTLADFGLSEALNYISTKNPDETIEIPYTVHTRNKAIDEILGSIVASKVRKETEEGKKIEGIYYAFAVRYNGRLQICFNKPEKDALYYHADDYYVTVDKKETIVTTPGLYIKKKAAGKKVSGAALIVENQPHSFTVIQK